MRTIRDLTTSIFRISDGSLHVWMVLLILLFLSVLSYALLIPRLGFYWDDWPAVWVSHSLGADGLREYMSASRPFEGWVAAWTAPLLGKTPLHWHIFALLTRWLSAVAVWWCLRGLWPQRVPEVASIAMLFAVYPGFAVQPIAWIHGLGYFIPLILFIVSLGAMIWALRMPKLFWPLTLLALFSSALSMMGIEHFVGLELLRPVLLWLVLADQKTSVAGRLRRTLLGWSPYLIVVGMFVTWRLFLFRTSVAFLDQTTYFSSFTASPLFWLKVRVRKAFTDVIESTLMAWGQTFRPDIFSFDSRSIWIAWGLVLLSAAAVILYMMRLRSHAESRFSVPTEGRTRWAKLAIVLGLLAVSLGGLPVWFADRHVIFESYSDTNRYTLAMMFGACIFLVGLIQLIIRSQLHQTILLGIIIGLAVGFHFRNADRFARDWSTQKSLYWQLSWRVPELKPGTALLMDVPPTLFIPLDYALTAPVNFLYAPQHSSPQLDHWSFNLSRDLGGKIPRLADGVPLKRVLMNYLSFNGSTSESLVVWFSPPSCLRVLDPQRDEIPQLSGLTRLAQPLSRLDSIIANPVSPARPPSEIFGPAPGPCWCYYFERADLARQMGDWQQVAEIGDESRRLGFKPDDPTEWLLFIEGYAQVERYADALSTAESALQGLRTATETELNRSQAQNESALVEPAFCALLKRLNDSPSSTASRLTFVADLNSQLSCSPDLEEKSGE